MGNAAIQLAVRAGAHVITTISSDAKAQPARSAGTDEVVDYTLGNVAERVRTLAPKGIDIVVEVAPAANLATDLALVKSRGTVAIYANDGGNQLDLNVAAAIASNARLQWAMLPATGAAELRVAGNDLTDAVAARAFDVGLEHGLPLHHFSLDQAAEAHSAVESGAVGKVMLDVSEA
ncbi:zinc-binding dehydrogenase [Streptomyces sp. NPDC026666]|uniref:zinc-binding dehydrogenase n=1 Tax=Streptomyces sp. NPDC026666 TaxID=3154799 RepID=UPI003453EEEE